jgi:hypothetical protein
MRGAAAAVLVLAASVGSATVAPRASGAATTASSEVTKTATVSRTHLLHGTDEPVESKSVTLTVSATEDLRDRQALDVSWSGAHPTGGVYPDANSGLASLQEYPMVLLQCRGIDSATAPAAQRLRPETCWAPTGVERYQGDDGSFPPWRIDRYETASNRRVYPDAAAPRPATGKAGCYVSASADRWVPFISASGTVYYTGANDCPGRPPEAAGLASDLALPSNTTYGVTLPDGTGSARFNIRTAEDNASLGCSDTVACALVAIPIMGVGCDVAAAGLPDADRPAAGDEATAADTECRKTGFFHPGDPYANGFTNLAVSGALWWSASNWKNRITVPLTFSAPSNVCDLVSKKASADIYGSELLTQATRQWAPHFCLNSALTPIKHIQTPEPQARNLLGVGTIEAAFVSNPPTEPYGRPTVHAPVAMTGFAISYAIDDSTKHVYKNLKLTPRLLAKLLTESYPTQVTQVRDRYTALKSNPPTMAADPEFKALNPGIALSAQASATSMFVMSSDSDVMHALTAYIDADPDARKWLDGTADPWGMVVNPNYKGIKLPVDSWPLKDSFVADFNPDDNPCLASSPVPYLPLVASPTTRLATISQALQFAISNAKTVCDSNTVDGVPVFKLKTAGREQPGFRFMLGVTSLGDAQRYGLDNAALQTSVRAGAAEKFSNAEGRTFVVPSDDSLRAAAALLALDNATKSWPIRYDVLRTDPGGVTAYPGSMLVYTDVPTTGLTAADATAYAAFLNFAAGPGQTLGFAAGQLPPGYLPLTAANGMAALAAYTRSAADAVAAQGKQVPTPPKRPNSSGTPSTPTPTAGSSTAAGPGVTGTSAVTSTSRQKATAAAPTAAPLGSTPATQNLGATVGQRSGLAASMLVLLLILAALGPVLVPALLLVRRLRARR